MKKTGSVLVTGCGVIGAINPLMNIIEEIVRGDVMRALPVTTELAICIGVAGVGLAIWPRGPEPCKVDSQ